MRPCNIDDRQVWEYAAGLPPLRPITVSIGGTYQDGRSLPWDLAMIAEADVFVRDSRGEQVFTAELDLATAIQPPHTVIVDEERSEFSENFGLFVPDLSDRPWVVFSSTGTLPAPLVAGRYYVATDFRGNSFKVAHDHHGAPIQFTTPGSGTITYRRLGEVRWTPPESLMAESRTLTFYFLLTDAEGNTERFPVRSDELVLRVVA
jgi:hypothetical protein